MVIQRAIGLRLQGFLWPNGEFSFGRVKTTSKPVGGLPVEDLDLWPNGDASVEHCLDRLEGRIECEPTSGLGLSNVANSHSSPGEGLEHAGKPRGSKGLTRHGAKMVRSGCYLIEQRCPKFCASFATLTLPPLDQKTRTETMESWHQILRIFFQRLNRHLVRAGLPGEIVYVIELHPKRGEKTGEPWPHIHCVFQGKQERYGSAWAISPEQLGKYWKEACCTHVPHSAAYWRKSHWNVQAVTKSCEQYLGKYLSKGLSKVIMREGELAEIWPIRNWYGCVGGLKKRILRAKVLLGTETCLALQDEAAQKNKDILYYSDINIKLDNGAKLWLGAAGRMKGELESEVRAIEGANRDQQRCESIW